MRFALRFLLISPPVLLLSFAFILFSATDAPAPGPFVGKITIVNDQSGQQGLDIIRSGKKDAVRAKTGDPLFMGDTVITGARTKAQVELSDRSLINLASGSSF